MVYRISYYFIFQCICEDVDLNIETTTIHNDPSLQYTKEYKKETKDELKKCDNLSINKSEVCSEIKINEPSYHDKGRVHQIIIGAIKMRNNFWYTVNFYSFPILR